MQEFLKALIGKLSKSKKLDDTSRSVARVSEQDQYNDLPPFIPSPQEEREQEDVDRQLELKELSRKMRLHLETPLLQIKKRFFPQDGYRIEIKNTHDLMYGFAQTTMSMWSTLRGREKLPSVTIILQRGLDNTMVISVSGDDAEEKVVEDKIQLTTAGWVTETTNALAHILTELRKS